LYLDITQEAEVSKLIGEQRPEIIIHVANNADARWCEANPEKAIKLNQKATEYIVSATNSINAKLIYISSFEAIRPMNVYANTKKESEKIIAKTKEGYLILRPSVILWFSPNTTNDRPFSRLLKNLDQGTPAVYDTSRKFQPSYLGHICEVIDVSIQKKLWNEIILVAVEDLKSRYDTAKDILAPFGITVEVADKHDTLPVVKEDLSKLKKLNLPAYSYDRMIQKIIDEINHRELFQL